ncbi:Ubiquitin carboxyl-terminal hydrolase 10, variant 2 [Schistosoma haematobium]|uniref:Ubiquitin carboxyl-terminal hydrolase 10, variant 2 n=1 Tax=Schistosoma haematobium TaxID=6185 RepID=A0A922LF95_SCHHA|nr:Ubiquitin carboxyl-terminal hydrolase 10, variant 2 [Schistosoma haematobium]KAH9581261.1 Ubiquitin carboxyl-terminal hydrolase 10, variant 2 [Schistosoma haematobium]
MKSLLPFTVQVTKTYNQRHCDSWQYAFKGLNIIQMSIPELLTSNWRSLNIYRKGRSRNKKRKLVEILCAGNSILYQNIILNKAINNNNSNHMHQINIPHST